VAEHLALPDDERVADRRLAHLGRGRLVEHHDRVDALTQPAAHRDDHGGRVGHRVDAHHRRSDHGVGVAPLPVRLAQPHHRGVEDEQVERLAAPQTDEALALACPQGGGGVAEEHLAHHGGLPLAHGKGDAHAVGAGASHRGVDRRLAEAAAVVEDEQPDHVARQLRAVEVATLVEERRAREEAEGAREQRVAARRLGGERVRELAATHRLDARQAHLGDLGPLHAVVVGPHAGGSLGGERRARRRMSDGERDREGGGRERGAK
jgi:hypothetical protein